MFRHWMNISSSKACVLFNQMSFPLFPGRSAPGCNVRRKGVRCGQDCSGHRAEVANRREATGVRVPLHRGRGTAGVPAYSQDSQSLNSPDLASRESSFLRFCTRSRSTPAQPSMSSPGELAWASWTCRRPMKRCLASCRSWAKSWTGVRRGGRYDWTLCLTINWNFLPITSLLV